MTKKLETIVLKDTKQFLYNVNLLIEVVKTARAFDDALDALDKEE